MSELSDLARDLREAAIDLDDEMRKVVKRGAQNVKTDARRRVRGIAHGPHYPRSITYDIHAVGDGWEAEIGPDVDIGQGFLGRIYEYGAAHSGPIPHMFPALRDEEPRFVDALNDVIGDVLW